MFEKFTVVHEPWEEPQPIGDSLNQLAWIMERIINDDLFRFGLNKRDIAKQLEMVVLNAGVALCYRDKRPLFVAEIIPERLRELYTEWKKTSAEQ